MCYLYSKIITSLTPGWEFLKIFTLVENAFPNTLGRFALLSPKYKIIIITPLYFYSIKLFWRRLPSFMLIFLSMARFFPRPVFIKIGRSHFRYEIQFYFRLRTTWNHSVYCNTHFSTPVIYFLSHENSEAYLKGFYIFMLRYECMLS